MVPPLMEAINSDNYSGCKLYFVYGQNFIFHENNDITHYPAGD